MIVVREREDRASADEVRHPVVRDVVGEAVTHVSVAGLEQQLHSVGTYGATCKRVRLSGQREPTSWLTSGDRGQDFCGGVEASLFLLAPEHAHIFVPETVGRDLVPTLDQLLNSGRIYFRGHGRDREGCFEVVLLQRRQHEIEPLMRSELSSWGFNVARHNTFRSARDAGVNYNVDRATPALRPADIAVSQTLLVRNGVPILP